MIITISTTQNPATDLGFLLHKHPDRYQTFDVPYGKADVFYPEASAERCTAALTLHLDPVALARAKSGNSPDGYVNDRIYAANSHLSVAIAEVFSNALKGRSQERQELADAVIPLECTVESLPCKGGEEFVREIFEPLGYQLTLESHALTDLPDETESSGYYTLHLAGTIRLQDLLSHLYVLLPVMDNDKHYYVGSDEVEKLVRLGGQWLAGHPKQDVITRRYLRYRRGLENEAAALLQRADDAPKLAAGDTETPDAAPLANESDLEKPLRLADQRTQAILETLRQLAPKSVIDLGCGEGRLIARLVKEPDFEKIAGMEVSPYRLERTRRRLGASSHSKQPVELLHGSLTYRDQRMNGFDAAIAMEVIEHIDPPRLDAFAEVIFGQAQPKSLLVTTPNAEYNTLFETLSAGKFRHRDHRFEWTRQEFQDWAQTTDEKYGYRVSFQGIGPEHETHGSPTQMGVFTR